MWINEIIWKNRLCSLEMIYAFIINLFIDGYYLLTHSSEKNWHFSNYNSHPILEIYIHILPSIGDGIEV